MANSKSAGAIKQKPLTAVPSSLTEGDVENLTEHLRDIQRLVRICYAAGGNEIEEFRQEIADTLGEEVLGHVWDALEIVEKSSKGRP